MVFDKTQEQNNDTEPTLKEKTAKGLFWGGISNGVQQVFQVIYGVIILILLDPSDWGIVGVLTIFLILAQTIQDSGFTNALINKKNILHQDYNAVFWFNLFISIIMYLGLFFAAPLIADFFNNPVLISVSRVLFLSFIINSFSLAHHAYILKNIMIHEKAKIEIISVFISLIIGIISAYNGLSYWAIVIQNLSYFSSLTILKWYFVSWKPTLNINFKPLKEFFSFSIYLLITSVFSRIIENIFSILLGRYYNEDTVGYYVQGNKWAVMGSSLISGMVSGVALPVLTQMSDNKDRQKNAFRKMLRFGSLISFPLLLGLAFVGKDFILMIGDKWIPAVPYLQLFCILNSVYFIGLLYIQLILTHKKSNIYMIGTFIISCLQLISIISTFRFGVFIMIISYIIISIIGLLFWHYYAHKLTGLKFWHVIKDIFPFLITTIGCILITFFITRDIENTYLRFTLKILITAILYTTIMWYSNSKIVRECYSFIKQKIR